MDNDEKNEEPKPEKATDQFAKLMLGAAASFIATKMAQNLYDTLVVERRNSTADTEQ